MKFKKFFAVMLSVSMLACLSACSNEESSSSKEDKEIQTETVAVKDSSSSVETSISIEEESSSLSETDDVSSENQSIEDIMNGYDNQNPEDTIISVLKTGFESSFGDNIDITYDDKDTNYIISVWQKGMAASLETEQGASALDSLSRQLESALEAMTTPIRLLDNDANLTFNVLSDEDKDTVLLTIFNGKMTYCITQE